MSWIWRVAGRRFTRRGESGFGRPATSNGECYSNDHPEDQACQERRPQRGADYRYEEANRRGAPVFQDEDDGEDEDHQSTNVPGAHQLRLWWLRRRRLHRASISKPVRLSAFQPHASLSGVCASTPQRRTAVPAWTARNGRLQELSGPRGACRKIRLWWGMLPITTTDWVLWLHVTQHAYGSAGLCQCHFRRWNTASGVSLEGAELGGRIWRGVR